MPSTGRQVALLLALVCALYYNALGNEFHYDDFHSIVRNPHIRDLANIPAFFVDPTLFSVDPKQAMYRPLLLSSYAVNYALDELDPRGYHLFNAILHAANVVWVLLLARGLGLGAPWGFAAALIFAVHPLNSEVVHYASSRSEALMAFFFLAACWSYMRYAATGAWPWYGVALACAGMALWSKSVAVVLPAVLVLVDGLAGRDWRRLWLRYLPFAVLALGYVLLVRGMVAKALGAPVRPLDVQILTQIKGTVYYALMGIVPAKLSVEHQFYPASGWVEPAVAAAGLLLASLGWLVWRGGRWPQFAAGWIVALSGPTFVVPLIVLVNEHRLYLPLAGWCLLLAWIGGRVATGGGRVALSGLAAYTILLAVFTLERGRVWSDELALWDDAAAKAPGMLKPHLRLGDALKKRGRVAEAEAAYLRALSLRKHHPATRNNLGALYKEQGRLAEAEAQFRALLAASPDIAHARLNLADLLLRQGRWSEAESECLQALEYADTGGAAQKMLALIALQHRGDPARALIYGEEALRLAPDAVVWMTHGVALKALDRGAEAERAYRRALALEPGAADAWYNLGNLYREQGRIDQAREAYGRVVELGHGTALGARAQNQISELNTIR